MLDKVIINKLECFGKHGVFKEENVLGQKFVVSAEMLVSRSSNDDLATSVNYGEVSLFIDNIVRNKVFKLIETLAENIAEGILKNFNVHEVTVKVEKPWAPVGLPLDSASVEIHRKWSKSYISFGSNMGEKSEYISNAIESIKANENIRVNKVSDIIVTKPYGGVEQDDFLNGCMEIETLYFPEQLLHFLQSLEQEAKRVRKVHWGPRTLDLDIVLYEDEIINTEELTVPRTLDLDILFYDNEIIDTVELHVPHIDMENRYFVLKPLSDIAPYAMHPIFHKSAIQMYKELEK